MARRELRRERNRQGPDRTDQRGPVTVPARTYPSRPRFAFGEQGWIAVYNLPEDADAETWPGLPDNPDTVEIPARTTCAPPSWP